MLNVGDHGRLFFFCISDLFVPLSPLVVCQCPLTRCGDSERILTVVRAIRFVRTIDGFRIF